MILDDDERFAADEARQALLSQLIDCHVPEGLHDGLLAYILTGRPTGQFLEAVLSNDLLEACHRADDMNRYRLYDIVAFLYNHMPAGAWGSPEDVQRWMGLGGWQGLRVTPSPGTISDPRR